MLTKMYRPVGVLSLLLWSLCIFRVDGFLPRATSHTNGGPAAPTHSSGSLETSSFLSSTSSSSSSSSLKMAASTKSSKDATVTIAPDFRLGGIFIALGLLLDTVPYLQWTLGPIVTALGVLFFVQTFRIQFICEPKSFTLLSGSQTNENIVVGGENRWDYKSFVNYDFFPKGWIDQPQGPILVYFKETQTPVEDRNGVGQNMDAEEAKEKGFKPGQVHFFPAICDCKQLRSEWERRGCKKL